ncbi:MAG: transposase, partial [Deltaproteobacteria bacterium]|nr:transposase [Deltaproteobacteria bacterium]
MTRLPMTYNECGRAISKAVRQDAWTDLGTLSDEPATPKKKPAYYHGYETVVDLYCSWHRALVIHWDALDERRQGRLERMLYEDRSEVERIVRKQEKIVYA